MKASKAFGSPAVKAVVTGALCAALLAGCAGAPVAKVDGTAHGQGQTTSEEVASASDANQSQTTAPSANVADRDYVASSEGYPALESFEAKTLDGKTFTSDDLAKADVTLINFWATYCGYCVDEMPEIAKWAKTLPNNVQVITVCVDYGTDPAAAKQILDEAGFTGTTLVSGTGDIGELASEVMYLPTTLVVDKTGKVVGDVLEGSAKDVSDTFGQMVNVALKEQGKAEINV